MEDFWVVLLVILIATPIAIVRSIKRGLRRKYLKNELIRRFIYDQVRFFEYDIENKNGNSFTADVEVYTWVDVDQNGINHHGPDKYRVDFKKNYLKPLNSDFERTVMAEAIVKEIIKEVSRKMPINKSHARPRFRLEKVDDASYHIKIVYTAKNRNYVRPKSW